MRLPNQLSQAATSHLAQLYFSTIWNAPDAQGRINFQIFPISPRSQMGSVSLDLSTVGLPTVGESYSTYRTSLSFFSNRFTIADDTWVCATDLETSIGISLMTYTGSGLVINPSQVYIRKSDISNTMIVAIRTAETYAATKAFVPALYMTLYQDTDRQTPTTYTAWTVTAANVATINATIKSTASNYPAGTLVVINGYVWDPGHVPTLNVGDSVCLMCDPDVIGSFDITVNDNQTGYYSQTYGEYREILHCPKSLNPNNIVVTHNTISAVVFDTASYRGLYFNRTAPHAIEQITHNDWSASRSVLTAFQTAMGAQSIVVRVFVRHAQKPLTLTDEISHINDLYVLSDSDIMLQLTGQSTKQVPQWTAASLEASPYLRLLANPPESYDADFLSAYVAGLSYYSVASGLAQSNRVYLYSGTGVNLVKPARLFGYPCDVIAYRNGVKVPASQVTTRDNGSYMTGLSFSADTKLAIGDRVFLYMLEKNSRQPILCQPTTASPTLVMDSANYTVWVQTTYDQPVTTYGKSVTHGYRQCWNGPTGYTTTTLADGTTQYTFGSDLLGQTLYLIPGPGLQTDTYDLTQMVNNSDALSVHLETTASDGTILPTMGYGSLEVYLNGYRLIEGFDYTLKPFIDANGYTQDAYLVISNKYYLNLTAGETNTLEVVTHGDVTVSEDMGYAVQNQLFRQGGPIVWSPYCGRAFVDGMAVDQVKEVGRILETTVPVRDGAPFLTQWMLPYSVGLLLSGFSPDADAALRDLIDKVLDVEQATYPDEIDLTTTYTLYSPYLANIIDDIASGALQAGNDIGDENFLAQFSQYDPIRDRDPVIGTGNPLLDRKIIGLAAHYANYAVSDATQMLIVQRLIELVLDPAALVLGEVLI